MKLQLLIEIDKLPGMQGTFAERKNMFVSPYNCFRYSIFSNILPAFLFLFVCFFWWVKSQSMELMH